MKSNISANTYINFLRQHHYPLQSEISPLQKTTCRPHCAFITPRWLLGDSVLTHSVNACSSRKANGPTDSPPHFPGKYCSSWPHQTSMLRSVETCSVPTSSSYPELPAIQELPKCPHIKEITQKCEVLQSFEIAMWSAQTKGTLLDCFGWFCKALELGIQAALGDAHTSLKRYQAEMERVKE